MQPTRADCADQIAFLTGGNVRRRFGQGKTRKSAEPFRCDHCGAWHVGTHTKRNRRGR